MLRNEKKSLVKFAAFVNNINTFCSQCNMGTMVGGGSFFCLWSRWLEWLADFELLDSHHVVKL